MLTQKFLQEYFIYNSDGSLTRIKKLGTSGRIGVKTFGYSRPSGYKVITFLNKSFHFHRIVFLLCNGFLPKMIDHINGDKADNRIENLRPCTPAENMFNSKIASNNKSGVKGIYYCKIERTWKGSIKKGNKRIKVQRKNKEELIGIMNGLREELHGNFARN